MAKDTLNMPAEVGTAVTAISGMETLGKTVFSLLFILALILALGYVLRHLNRSPRQGQQLLRQVASASLGPRERVVVMEVNDTWLVLGVGSGGIRKLHECEALATDAKAQDGNPGGDRFADRLAQLLKPAKGLGDSR